MPVHIPTAKIAMKARWVSNLFMQCSKPFAGQRSQSKTCKCIFVRYASNTPELAIVAAHHGNAIPGSGASASNTQIVHRVTRAANYGQSSRDELLDMLLNRDATIDTMLVEKNKEQRSKNYYMRRCNDLKQQLAQRDATHSELVAITNFRPGKRNISLYGGYALALNRSKGHASASTAISMMAGWNIKGHSKIGM